MLYWKISWQMNTAIFSNETQLNQHYGRGFNKRALYRMVRFANIFPEDKIAATLLPLLSRSHFIELISLLDVNYFSRFVLPHNKMTLPVIVAQ